MKRLKLILALVTVIGAAGAGIPYFLPAEFEVQKSVVLPVKPYAIFPHLNNLAQWERWSAWSHDWDPTISRFYKGPASGLGAECSWKGEKTDGKVTITESRQNELLAFEFLVNNGTLKTQSYVQLQPEENGTRLTWFSKGQPVNYFGRIENYFQRKRMEQDFERGFQGLNDMLVPKQSRLSLVYKKVK